jgi:hypothetical protein
MCLLHAEAVRAGKQCEMWACLKEGLTKVCMSVLTRRSDGCQEYLFASVATTLPHLEHVVWS